MIKSVHAMFCCSFTLPLLVVLGHREESRGLIYKTVCMIHTRCTCAQKPKMECAKKKFRYIKPCARTTARNFIFINLKSTWKCARMNQPHIPPSTRQRSTMVNVKRLMNIYAQKQACWWMVLMVNHSNNREEDEKKEFFWHRNPRVCGWGGG